MQINEDEIIAYGPISREGVHDVPSHLMTAAFYRGELWMAADLIGDDGEATGRAYMMGEPVIHNGDNKAFVRVDFLINLCKLVGWDDVAEMLVSTKKKIAAHHASQLN